MVPTALVSMPAKAQNFAALGKLLRAIAHREGAEVSIGVSFSKDGSDIVLTSSIPIDWDRSVPLITMFDVVDCEQEIDETTAFRAGNALRAIWEELNEHPFQLELPFETGVVPEIIPLREAA